MARDIDSTKWLKINGQSLREAIKRRGYTQNGIANELGCGCALSNAIHRDKISMPLSILLESKYGITIEEMTKRSNAGTEKEPSRPEEIIIAPQFSEEQWNRLATIIKDAMLEALKGL